MTAVVDVCTGYALEGVVSAILDGQAHTVLRKSETIRQVYWQIE
jgi:hypothetical protein